MTPKESRAMEEIRNIRKNIENQTKEMSIHEKFVWIHEKAKKSKLRLSIVDPSLRKAS